MTEKRPAQPAGKQLAKVLTSQSVVNHEMLAALQELEARVTALEEQLAGDK